MNLFTHNGKVLRTSQTNVPRHTSTFRECGSNTATGQDSSTFSGTFTATFIGGNGTHENRMRSLLVHRWIRTA